MRTISSHRAATLLAVTAILAAAGCSTKAKDSGSSSSGAAGSVKTGTGISGTTISLGVLTDLTGPFAALGKDVTNAQQLYWENHQVCGKYKVTLNVKDHGYKTPEAVQLYNGMKDSILAIQQTIGSPINTALDQQLQSDKMVNIPEAWARNLTTNPGNMVVGATYDVEMINGIDYLLKNGKLKDGDAVGHIYYEGEYGANGLAGSKYMAGKHNLKLTEEKIKTTDTDMTPQVTDLKSKGVKAIFLTVAQAQLGSAASVASAQGLTVPFLGNNPVYDPGLLGSPSAAFIKANYVAAAPFVSFDKAAQLLKDYQAKYAGARVSTGVVHGYADSIVMNKVLDAACKSGDLTRDGVLAAKKALTNVDTNGLIVPLDFSKIGQSPSQDSYILQPADVPGGVKTVQDAKASADLSGYKPA
ncbi:MAG: ABC transporter substrate-binding protein [Mycobacteriales bacterium]